MAWGLAAAVGIQAVSGIAQLFQSEKARKASNSRLNEIARAFEALVPPGYDISPNDPPEYIQGQLADANFDYSKLTPQQFQLVGTYAPEAAEYIAEENPTLIQGSAAAKEGRQAQLDTLRQIQQIARGGDNYPLRSLFEQANQASQAEAQQRAQATMQDAQRRGMGNSGMTFAAMLQGNADSMAGGAAASRDEALAAYNARRDALTQAASLGGDIAASEYGIEQSNADILNSFNQRTTRAYQDYLNNRANLQNEAKLTNLQNAQNIANQNVSQNNQAQQWNISNNNQLAQQNYNNSRDERNYQNTLAENKANWAASEKDRQNALKTQSYNDQLAKLNGKYGIASAQNQATYQTAADRNNVFQGIADAFAGGLAQKRDDDRWAELIAAQKKG